MVLAVDDNYVSSGSDFSVTTLIDAPQIRWLRERNPWAHEVDIVDRIAAMIGTGIHQVFEEASAHIKNVKVEQKIVVEVSGKKIAGKIDKVTYHDEGDESIHDLKVVRVQSLNYDGGPKPDWVKQLNIYAAIKRLTGSRIRDLWVDLIIKDWTKGQLKYNQKYPVSPVSVVPVPMMEPAEAQKYLEDRIAAHMQDPPAECTQEEYWGQDPKYAIYEKFKNGTLKKRATRVLNSSIDADAYIHENRLQATVVMRPGRRVRCEENYCGVASVCPQYKRYLDEVEATMEDGGGE